MLACYIETNVYRQHLLFARCSSLVGNWAKQWVYTRFRWDRKHDPHKPALGSHRKWWSFMIPSELSWNQSESISAQLVQKGASFHVIKAWRQRRTTFIHSFTLLSHLPLHLTLFHFTTFPGLNSQTHPFNHSSWPRGPMFRYGLRTAEIV